MKPIILFLLLVAGAGALIASCSKEKLFKKDIYGKWELRWVSGFKIPYTEHAPGNGTSIELTKAGIINRYEKGKIIHTTSFSVHNKKIECNGYDRDTYWELVYDNIEDEIEVRNDTLILSTPPCTQDGGTSTYVRIYD
ncbi:hypothetical protein A8C56_17400 [Niabella ginsenosidivorans]|uniref:Lipocalin-like domain-containing protein n=1 Tax=Niabella ginsenosidivorans TaxID=1176587 RepID=A0A1A9I739_9BACT|nr:hypothetical protein [Niabella ginsenosidivorans]ANH82511.1 hypothetical protein A8C56_17400 [Niabella ginsenosidivorans]